MPLLIPVQPAVPHYRATMPIDGVSYHFDFRWNTREGAWFFDVISEDDVTIAIGIKVALGTYLGRHINHRLFRMGAFFVIDREADTTSAGAREPGFYDFGIRCLLVRYAAEEIYGPGLET